LLEAFDLVHFEAFSAGIIRGETHSLTVEVLKEIGIDVGTRTARTTDDVINFSFDFVITLSDPAKTEHPDFPGAELIHWRFDDPSAVSDPDKKLRLFRSLRDQIAQRVRLFVLVQTRFASAS
jgi:arsenate reductase